jgi:hypothetical protein
MVRDSHAPPSLGAESRFYVPDSRCFVGPARPSSDRSVRAEGGQLARWRVACRLPGIEDSTAMRSFVLPEIESHAAASLAGLRAGEPAAMGGAPSDLEAPHRTPPGAPSTADRSRPDGGLARCLNVGQDRRMGQSGRRGSHWRSASARADSPSTRCARRAPIAKTDDPSDSSRIA